MEETSKQGYEVIALNEETEIVLPSNKNQRGVNVTGLIRRPSYMANGRRTCISATLALNYDPLVRRTWEETAPMRKGKIEAAEATLDRMIYMMGDSPPQVACEIPVSMKRKGIKDSKISKPHSLSAALELSLDHPPSSQPEDEADSNSATTSEETDDKSESEMIAMKSQNGTEPETAGVIAGEILDTKLQQLGFQYSSLHADKEISPEGGCLSVDKCSLTIPPKSVVDTQNLSIGMLMNFRNLGLPADRVPISPCLKVKFGGKLRIPAKVKVPTWFKASKGSEHAIKIFKRNRDEENNLVWRELEIEVKVHDDIIEFEVDHFCWFITMMKEWLWESGEMKLTHGLFQSGQHFLSVFCYRSPEFLYQQNAASLEKNGFKEIHRDHFVMSTKQGVPIRMECIDEDLHEFEPQQYLLSPSAIKANHTVKFPFRLQHLKEPMGEVVDIRYIVNGLAAPLAVRLPGLQQLVCQYCLLGVETEIGPEEGNLAMVGNWFWRVWQIGQIQLTLGLFERGRKFVSVICHRSPKCLFNQNVTEMEDIGYKEICRGNFLMNNDQTVSVRMECLGPHLYEFEPHQYLLTPLDIKSDQRIKLSFLLRQSLIGLKDEVTKCTTRDFSFWFARTQATFVSGTIPRRIPDVELQQLEFQYRTLHADKKIGPKGGELSIDQCSLTIPSNSVAETQNLCIYLSMDFQKLDLPADKIPVSPFLGVKFRGELLIPAKVALPTWFRPSIDLKQAIKMYKRFRDEENKFTWHELQNEVKVHDDIIEFEVDHFCGFVAAIPDWAWEKGKTKLLHGLFHRERSFRSVFSYRSSLFGQIVDDLSKSSFEEIHRDIFVMNNNQAVPVKMECIDVDLHKFDPKQYLLIPSHIKEKGTVRFYFALRHCEEPKNEVDIRYIVDDSSASLVARLPVYKENRGIMFNISSLTRNMFRRENIAETQARDQAIAAGRDNYIYRSYRIDGGVLVFCGIFVLVLLFGLLPRFLQSYSTGHDEI